MTDADLTARFDQIDARLDRLTAALEARTWRPVIRLVLPFVLVLGVLMLALVMLLAFVVVASHVGLANAVAGVFVAIIAAAYASDCRQRRRGHLLT